MNKWVLLYILFAPCFGLAMFFWFNRSWIMRKWWLYTHPQSVYKIKVFYPNKMYEERFISSWKESFNFRDGTYNIRKQAILRKNWTGLGGGLTKVPINEANCLHFEHFKIYHKERFGDVPDKAVLIGELHYIFNIPDPLIYNDAEDIVNKQGVVVGDLIEPYRNASKQNRVEKNSVLDQLLTAQFKKTTLIIIIILCVFILVVSGYNLLLRLELIKQPLHAVCVNIGGGTP